MKDSLLLYDVYRRYLNVTSDLITILERHCQSQSKSPEIKKKHEEFREHTHDLIENLNADLHTLLKMDTELKELENTNRITIFGKIIVIEQAQKTKLIVGQLML